MSKVTTGNVTRTSSNEMIKQPLEEWRQEATQRFGEKGRNWKFVCPRCGNIQSGQDFIDRGMSAENAQNTILHECIGRHYTEVGCNWAAYGLFGTMGKGRIVITDDGKEVEVFDFAPAPEQAEGAEE